MNKEMINNIMAAWQEVVNEKKKLDPVDDDELKGTHAQRKDKDIDNDGDADGSDEYLHNRRATIKKKMKRSRSGKLGGHEMEEGLEACPNCGCEECECELEESKDLDTDNVGKALRHDCASHVTSEEWGYGECIPGQHTLVEQEDGSAIVTHYDVMFEHGIEFDVPVSELKIMKSEAHLHANYKKKMKKEDDDPCWDSHKQVGMKKKGGKMVPNCVPKEEVEHVQEGWGKSKGGNKPPKGSVRIDEETVAETSEEIEKTYIEILAERMARITRVWERANHGNVNNRDSWDEKMSGKGAKDFAKEVGNIDSPKHADITPEEEGHDDATKAGRVTKAAPARGAADNLSTGDKKIVKGGK
jgi:hypothetical protein